MSIPLTFEQYFKGLLNATVTWEQRTGKDANGNPAYAAPVTGIPCNRQMMNTKEGGRVRFSDVHAPLIDPTDIAYLGPTHSVTTLDRLTFDTDPTIPFIVTDMDRYFDRKGVIWYIKVTLTYQTKTTGAA